MNSFGVETAAEESARINQYLNADDATKARLREEYRTQIVAQYGAHVVIDALNASTSGNLEVSPETPDNYGIIE